MRNFISPLFVHIKWMISFWIGQNHKKTPIKQFVIEYLIDNTNIYGRAHQNHNDRKRLLNLLHLRELRKKIELKIEFENENFFPSDIHTHTMYEAIHAIKYLYSSTRTSINWNDSITINYNRFQKREINSTSEALKSK